MEWIGKRKRVHKVSMVFLTWLCVGTRTIGVRADGGVCSGSRSNKVKSHSVDIRAHPCSNGFYRLSFGEAYDAKLPRKPSWARLAYALECRKCHAKTPFGSVQCNLSTGPTQNCSGCGQKMTVSLPIISEMKRELELSETL